MRTSFLPISLLMFASYSIYAQPDTSDLARYTPQWIRQGFADAGATHEPWIFQVRRNNPDFNQWQKADFEYQLSEPYIKDLAEAGITVYHVGCYKGFGFKAEKEYMDKVAQAVAIAHKYGLKADTYVQWNTMAYETFFTEVPEAKTDQWYQIDENGKPLLLTYSYQQAYRYRPCFNHDGYMNYFKEKIIRYVVEKVKTDFIHFDNYDFNYPPAADFNPATIASFRKFLQERYSPEQRIERFGFADVSYVLPPMWNDENPANKMEVVDDPVIQEWIDFRCWTLTSRLAECARFVRGLNKEIVIEVNPHGLVGSNRAWEAGINHPDLMQYTNVIWTEDDNNPRWEKGVAIGKFRHFKLGRTTKNYIMTYCGKPNDFAENLALNRTIGFLGTDVPGGVAKQYLDFWREHKDLFTNVEGAERVAVLRSYPSMAYNNLETQIAVNMAEQVLQQRQIPFDIIFDQQLEHLNKYYVIVLADQESLSDESVKALKNFVREGGGIVMTENSGKFDKWRRIRKVSLTDEMLGESDAAGAKTAAMRQYPFSFNYGKGEVICLSGLFKSKEEVKLGMETVWMVPENSNELESAIYWAAGRRLTLQVKAPEWIGVSHDSQQNREVIHLFNYKNAPAVGITLEYNGTVKKAWSVSPDYQSKKAVPFTKEGNITVLKISDLAVYEIIVLER
jgi:uncharacterized protein YegP (UPF0339 family)